MGLTATIMPNIIYDSEYSGKVLNEIGGDLMAQALTTDFAAGTYGVNALNGITADLINKGIFKNTGDGCAPELVGGSVKIKSGLAVFSNGIKARIDSNGEILPFTAGVVNYVYLLCDMATNKVEAKCEATSPTTGDYIMVAEISAAGVLTDKRQYALMKNASVLPNLYSSPLDVSFVSQFNMSWVKVHEVFVGTGYRFARINAYNVNNIYYLFGLFDFNTNMNFGIYQRTSSGTKYPWDSIQEPDKGVLVSKGPDGPDLVYLKLVYNNGFIEFWCYNQYRAESASFKLEVF